MIGTIADRDIAIRAVAHGKDSSAAVREIMSESIVWAMFPLRAPISKPLAVSIEAVTKYVENFWIRHPRPAQPLRLFAGTTKLACLIAGSTILFVSLRRLAKLGEAHASGLTRCTRTPNRVSDGVATPRETSDPARHFER